MHIIQRTKSIDYNLEVPHGYKIMKILKPFYKTNIRYNEKKCGSQPVRYREFRL